MSNCLPKKFHLADDNLNAVAYYRADIVVRMGQSLERLVDDIEDYERVNNLAPSPGKNDCWQSVTRAKAAISAWKEAEQSSQLALNEALNRGDADVLR